CSSRVIARSESAWVWALAMSASVAGVPRKSSRETLPPVMPSGVPGDAETGPGGPADTGPSGPVLVDSWSFGTVSVFAVVSAFGAVSTVELSPLDGALVAGVGSTSGLAPEPPLVGLGSGPLGAGLGAGGSPPPSLPLPSLPLPPLPPSLTSVFGGRTGLISPVTLTPMSVSALWTSGLTPRGKLTSTCGIVPSGSGCSL